MCEALEVLAARGVVHADLKPDNILLSYDSATSQLTGVKLIDFGSSFAYRADGNI